MYVTSVRLEGLWPADSLERALSRPVATLGADPAGLAALDAFDLFVAGCDPGRTGAALASIGVVPSASDAEVTVEDALPAQVTLHDGDAAGLLGPHGGRTVKVRLDFALDPVLFGRLSEWALRDPRLASGLADATASVTIGWAFTNDRTTAAVARLQVRIGEARFSTGGAERPAWLAPFLHDVAGRFRRVGDEPLDAIAARVHAAAFSGDLERRKRARALMAALAAPPFDVGALELLVDARGVRAAFGPELLPPRRLGRTGQDRVRIAEAAILDQPDVLLVDRVDPTDAALLAWLRGASTGDGAILEQVIVADGPVA